MSNKKHGSYKSRTYQCWSSMLSRVRGTSGKKSRHIYTGMYIDPRWTTFENFLQDMGERPEDTSLDRIDGSKGYYKENCRWATIYQQAENRTTSVFVELDGVRMCLSAAARLTGVDINKVKARYKRGERDVVKLLCKSDMRLAYVEIDGESMCLSEIARLYNLDNTTVWRRYERGDRSLALLSRPIQVNKSPKLRRKA